MTAIIEGSERVNYVFDVLLKDLAKTPRPVYLLNFEFPTRLFETYPKVVLVDAETFELYPLSYLLPLNAVFIVNDAQRFFSPQDKDYPQFLKYFRFHRHYGHDFYFVTQSAQLLEPPIRQYPQYCHMKPSMSLKGIFVLDRLLFKFLEILDFFVKPFMLAFLLFLLFLSVYDYFFCPL
ncbi:zonular occludens toxin domain-containing protein [Beggiatoa leptomitoformis]|uniref:Zona occludens toxin N-terminal domain-containing protein n=1 Tax=Beggiatoa leptomitoformis TaxID=288004 RepID=A0A2N9YBQ9_9GAMM|nr:zonular occludens toxin domain-containing protein [Beggiatoa leptomitoformis]ALG66769.1 hypothetical protein AL038_02380 [Beggiatoa leptomitoformis]AUI67886.1 hypothetical protein BLE401_03660 [Beggiatoa leptomitoformis]